MQGYIHIHIRIDMHTRMSFNGWDSTGFQIHSYTYIHTVHEINVYFSDSYQQGTFEAKTACIKCSYE